MPIDFAYIRSEHVQYEILSAICKIKHIVKNIPIIKAALHSF